MFRDFFANMPPVIKNLLFLNIALFIFIITGGYVQNGMGDIFYERNGYLGIYYFGSPNFKPYQILSHLFSHGNFTHLLFNMLSMVMIGSVLERVWGAKRFLIFYFVCGFGAVALSQLVHAIEVYKITGQLIPVDSNFRLVGNTAWYSDAISQSKIGSILGTPTVGASGAIFGLMVAFAILFPNTEFMLLLFPIPVKAKYFVPLMLALEYILLMQNNPNDHVGHLAHLGGALFGAIMVWIWKRNRNTFY